MTGVTQLDDTKLPTSDSAAGSSSSSVPTR